MFYPKPQFRFLEISVQSSHTKFHDFSLIAIDTVYAWEQQEKNCLNF